MRRRRESAKKGLFNRSKGLVNEMRSAGVIRESTEQNQEINPRNAGIDIDLSVGYLSRR